MTISWIQNLAAQASTPAEPGAGRPLTDEHRNLIQAAKAVDASDSLERTTELTLVLDPALRRAVTQIAGKQTGEVVEEVPPEHVS
jgi:uncharacterized FlaG/YvyC family protein